MRSPFRWRLRNLLLAVVLIGFLIGSVALRRRADRLRGYAQEYAAWDGKLTKIVAILDNSIRRDRDMVVKAERDIQLMPGHNNGRLVKYSAKMERHIELRAKLIDLREYTRLQEQRYILAAYRPWEMVSVAKPIGPMAEALTRQFFAPDHTP